MPRNEQDLLNFLAKRFRLVEAICAKQSGFDSHDELLGYLSAHSKESESIAWLAKRLKQVGILVENASGWSPPPFLVRFVRELHKRHVLASPKVVRGWIEELERHADAMVAVVEKATSSIAKVDELAVATLLNDVEYTFSEIVRIVHENCDRIASDVVEYRTTEDVSQLRNRLTRLIFLHTDYLEPIILLIDINGSFYEVSEKIAYQCSRLGVEDSPVSDRLRRQAIMVKQLVTRLRVAVIRQADEAKRELAPLCLAAAQEQKISKGVNRILEVARNGDLAKLRLPQLLKIVDDRNGPTFSDWAIESYMQDAISYTEEAPPRVILDSPEEFDIPVSVEELIDKLEVGTGVDDVLEWILDTNEEIGLEEAVQLFQAAIDLRPDCLNPTDEIKPYERPPFETDAYRWTWKENGNSNNRQNRDAPKAGRIVSNA